MIKAHFIKELSKGGPNAGSSPIHDFISRQPLAVISTVSGSQAHSALIAFSQNENLEIYFMTFADSRKYRHLQSNPAVSLVLGLTISPCNMATKFDKKILRS